MVRTVYTETQTGKSREERKQNVEGIFELTTTCPNAVLLLDDVLTTGATLLEAAKVLQAAGAQQIWIASVGVAGYT
jgi:predicted amidophosphoribosyltransferase